MKTWLWAVCLTVLCAGAAGATCASPANAVEAENCLPGDPQSAWDISPAAGDPSIGGYAAQFTYNRGQTAQFKVKSDGPYRVDVYRLGYYGGLGARKVATLAGTAPAQPPCDTDSTNGLIDCGNWTVTASWDIPADAVSGIYVAKLVRTDTGGASHVPFVVRHDGGAENILFQTADTTWQAYNPWGGSSLYINGPTGSGWYKVSYNRPMTTRGSYPLSLFHQEYPMVRWLEANGYDVAYFTNWDAATRGGQILNHRVFMPVGQQEYISKEDRASIEAARAAGVHLAFIESVWGTWKTRWEDGGRTLVCYKESARGHIDPQDPPSWTGFWRDNHYSPTSDGGRPENALVGQSFSADAIRGDALLIPAEFGDLRFWRNTAVAAQSPGQVMSFPSLLGPEWDVDFDNGSRPAGLIRMSSTTVTVPKALNETYQFLDNVPITHRVVLYKHASGALVFATGTMDWPWGLDNVHSGGGGVPVQPALRQATVNILADMGVQPASLQPGLTPASASTDAAPPVAYVTPPSGAAVGQTQLLTGTATDSGGVVAGVEVSTDGATWHPAEGRGSWRYAWRVTGPASVRARAVDDSANIGSPTAPLAVVPGGGPPAGPAVADIVPSSAPVGAEPLSLTVEGSGFMSGAVVRWDDEPKPTTYMGAGMLRAALSADDLMDPGPHAITVMNPTGTVSAQAKDFLVIGPAATALSDAKIFPNPWRADRHAGVGVTFGSLPPASEVKLFTASGRHVRTLDAGTGTSVWDLKSDDGSAAASGYYLYLISDGAGGHRRGTLALIR
jgi:hypothetical protein